MSVYSPKTHPLWHSWVNLFVLLFHTIYYVFKYVNSESYCLCLEYFRAFHIQDYRSVTSLDV